MITTQSYAAPNFADTKPAHGSKGKSENVGLRAWSGWLESRSSDEHGKDPVAGILLVGLRTLASPMRAITRVRQRLRAETVLFEIQVSKANEKQVGLFFGLPAESFGEASG